MPFTEADQLNRIFDLKEDLRRERVRLNYLKKTDPDSDDIWELAGRVNRLKSEIARLREGLWKGVKSKHTYKCNFSTRFNRTGRVLPKQNR